MTGCYDREKNIMSDINYKFKYCKIEDIYHIFCCLSDTTFSAVELSIGKKGPYIISCETMMSMMKTIETIDFCCYRGAYSDAYMLIRKCRDDLLQYLFILKIIKNRHGLTEAELEQFCLEPESLIKMIEMEMEVLISGDRKTEAELAAEKWFYNELSEAGNARDRKKFFEAAKYKSYLMCNDKDIKYIFQRFLCDKWKYEDRKLNNYVHTNGIKYLTDNYQFQENIEKKDQELIETLQNVIDIFLTLLAVIDSTKLQSSDYRDAVETDTKPPEGSQYWVCPIIVGYMNDRFDIELLKYLQENEKNGMQILQK